jgi:hypothetical protein
MNKRDAKRIAETVTHAQLLEMFERAKWSIKDWKEPSKANPGITLGAAWNMYYPAIMKNLPSVHLRMAKTNMIWVFGDYLPAELKPVKKDQCKSPAISVFHQEPIFEVMP